MKQIFSYNKFNEDVADGLVESLVTLSEKALEGKANTAEYCVEQGGMTWTGMEMIKSPMVYKKTGFLETFDTIMAGAITPVVPTVAAMGYEQLYDVVQVGFGVA